MTTLGKILVFLVFIAALAVGGLMVFVAKTTPNWADAVKERDEKLTVFREMLKQENESRQKLLRENEKMKQLLDAKIKESSDQVVQLELDKKKLAEQVTAAHEQQEKEQTTAAKAGLEAKQLQKELEFSQTVVRGREKTITDLQEEIGKARNAEQAAKNEAVTAAARLQSLFEQLKEKERVIADLTKKSQPGGVPANGPKDATYSNPPPVYVKGRIESVSDDKTLVKITIGSDSGLRKDQTLEVYRLSPKAEYLGRLLIVDADLHHAVARLLRQPGVQAAALQPGDEVASKLRQ